MDSANKVITSIFLLLGLQAAEAQPWRSYLCTADSRTSLAIQQVDDNWNPIPFDCEHIAILIEGEAFKREFKPGQYIHCPKNLFAHISNEKILSQPISLLSKNPGIYQVTVERFDEVSTFTDVVVELDETGCHAVGPTLEVHFDMSKTQ
ncbi:hypothetical protein [Marinicella meishanensis]|uniref:hypothetical protein n=1 Tax=Marinicella meishanensis TaxID=2873263 RepID=UPI001CBBC325|nr:hypothetical protein [Marinicella sp. NBU2979]